MLKKTATNVLLFVGVYTVITKAPAYMRTFKIGFDAGRRGESLESAIDKMNAS